MGIFVNMIPIEVVFPFLLSSVSAHGGILWPPIWQDGVGLAIEDLKDHHVHSDPLVKDPDSGLTIWHSNQWLTDQAYTGGIGDEFMGTGPLTNKENKNLKSHDRCKNTYRLCKVPEKGRAGITEECFTKHVLEFATNFTMIKAHEKNSTGVWEKLEQTDLREGTFPCGSVWRPIGKVVKKFFIIRKDSVVVPHNLSPGEYALSLRWDVAGGNQVWVSCSSVRLVGESYLAADEDADEDEEEDN